MSVQLPTYGGRERTAALLETPARAIVAEAARDGWSIGSEAFADLRAVIAELDAIDANVAAERRNTARRAEVFEAVHAELVTPAPADARCSVVAHKYVIGKPGKQLVSHAAKVLLKGTAYCLTHAKRPIENAIGRGVAEREAERQARGEYTADELLIIARREELDARRDVVRAARA